MLLFIKVPCILVSTANIWIMLTRPNPPPAENERKARSVSLEAFISMQFTLYIIKVSSKDTKFSEQLLKSSTVLHWRCCLDRNSSPSRPTCTRSASLLLSSFTKPPHLLRWLCGTYMCLSAVFHRNFDDNSWRINKIHMLSSPGTHVHLWDEHP